MDREKRPSGGHDKQKDSYHEKSGEGNKTSNKQSELRQESQNTIKDTEKQEQLQFDEDTNFKHLVKHTECIIKHYLLSQMNPNRLRKFVSKKYRYIITDRKAANVTKVLPLLSAHYGGFLLSQAIVMHMDGHEIKDNKEYLPPDQSAEFIQGYQVVGSTIEGVGTTKSDIDAMFVIDPVKFVSKVLEYEIKSVDDLQYSPSKDHPLYLKVEVRREDEKPVLIASKEFKKTLSTLLHTKHPSSLSHGPSDKGSIKLQDELSPDGGSSYGFDKVYCLPLPESVTKPYFDKWKERVANKGFFHAYHIDAVIHSKCYLVPVGPTLNDETSWRISFSLAECIFMNFLSNVHKAVFLIVKTALKRHANIPSYYIKTVFMRMCEDLKRWKQENIFALSRELKRRIILALSKREITHYFVPECNILAAKPRFVIHNYLQGVIKSSATFGVESISLHNEGVLLSDDNWKQSNSAYTLPFTVDFSSTPQVSVSVSNTTDYEAYAKMLENIVMNWCLQKLVLFDQLFNFARISLAKIAQTFVFQVCHIEKSLLPITQEDSWNPLLATAVSKIFLANVFSSLEYAKMIDSSETSYGPTTIGRLLLASNFLGYLQQRKQFDKLCETSPTGTGDQYLHETPLLLQLSLVYVLHLIDIVVQNSDECAQEHPLLTRFLIFAKVKDDRHKEVRKQYDDVILEMECAVNEALKSKAHETFTGTNLQNALLQAKVISAAHILCHSETDRDEQAAWQLLQDARLSDAYSQVSFEIWQKEFFKHNFPKIYERFPRVVSSEFTIKLSSKWLVQCLLDKIKPSNMHNNKNPGKHVSLGSLVDTIMAKTTSVIAAEDKQEMLTYLAAYASNRLSIHQFLTSCVYFQESKFTKFVDEITSVRSTYRFLSTVIRVLENTTLLLPFLTNEMKELFPWLSLTNPAVVRREGDGDTEICVVDCRTLFDFVLYMYRGKLSSKMDFEFSEKVGLEDLQY